MSRYEEICAEHEWNVPERYNIAADICDKHPPDKLAMIFEDHTGTRREVTWGEQQALASRAANMLEAHGVGRGDRVAVCVPASPETAAVFFGTWKVGGILIAMSVLYGDDGIEHRIRTSGAKVIVTDSADAGRMPADLVDHVIELDADLLAGYDDSYETLDTLADDPAEIFFTSGTTGLAKGILHAHRYILAHEEFEYCHEIEDGEIFHGMGEWAWAAGICPLLGAWRLGAVQYVYARKGGFDPEVQLEALSRNGVSNVFTTPTAMRAMMSIEDAGEKYPQVFRRVCSAGEALNPEAIRWFREQYGVTVLDYYGLSESYPLVGNFPFMEVREGSMGKPMPGWDVQILDPDENPVGPGERGEICMRARSNPHYPLRYWENPEATERDFEGEWFHTKDAAEMDEDGYYLVRRPGRRRDHLGRLPDRPLRGGVGLRRAPGRARSGRGGRARPDRGQGRNRQGLHRAERGLRAIGRARRRHQGSVRGSLSAYAYPREIEFVDDLPKTLTGKIRRIELRNAGELRRVASDCIRRRKGADADSAEQGVCSQPWCCSRGRRICWERRMPQDSSGKTPTAGALDRALKSSDEDDGYAGSPGRGHAERQGPLDCEPRDSPGSRHRVSGSGGSAPARSSPMPVSANRSSRPTHSPWSSRDEIDLDQPIGRYLGEFLPRRRSRHRQNAAQPHGGLSRCLFVEGSPQAVREKL